MFRSGVTPFLANVRPMLAASCALMVIGCSGDPEAAACREGIEMNLDAPSTITGYQSAVEPRELGKDFSMIFTLAECKQMALPAVTCDALTKEVTFEEVYDASEKSGKDFDTLYKAARDRIEREQKIALQSLPDSQRKLTVHKVSFDASNSFGTPIRHEADCVFISGKGEAAQRMIDFRMYRGFE